MYILYVYTAIVMAGVPYTFKFKEDWRPNGEFTTEAKCVRAIEKLGYAADRAQCLPK